ncbi:TetR/AcrR family transcriptional regulator [Nocardioides taihuensis]|jgi:AcrR family transcriptional regulator|uniref:TetR/AcrR family transcriptional regulator n=1 Tax=Nocardioides taihuensis TaxID=1835606 RepID=A0ABW0BH84_9ACTN
MTRDTGRRQALADAATDYVLEHGLIGLSLRPLAAEIGTSDRMLLYHFDSKDDLIAAVISQSSDRSVDLLRARPVRRGVRATVLDVWQAMKSAPLDQCSRVYAEAAALGLLGREPYVTVVQEANERWTGALADHLVDAGAERRAARRAANLIDATFMGLLLDLPLAPDDPDGERVVRDVADAAAAITGRAGAQGRA